jgi:hypothetical protein
MKTRWKKVAVPVVFFVLAAMNNVPRISAQTTAPSAPLNVKLSPQGTDELRITWEPPRSGGLNPILGYVVQTVVAVTPDGSCDYSVLGQPQTREGTPVPNCSTYGAPSRVVDAAARTLDLKVPITVPYYAKVWAFNGEGLSQPGISSFAQYAFPNNGPPAAVPAPAAVRATEISPGTVTVSWDQPAGVNEFEVSYNDSNSRAVINSTSYNYVGLQRSPNPLTFQVKSKGSDYAQSAIPLFVGRGSGTAGPVNNNPGTVVLVVNPPGPASTLPPPTTSPPTTAASTTATVQTAPPSTLPPATIPASTVPSTKSTTTTTKKKGTPTTKKPKATSTCNKKRKRC